MSVTDLSLEAKATRWGEAVVAAAITQRPINYIAGSTYNEYLDILPLEHMGTNKIPAIKYVGLGIGSNYMKSITHPISNEVIDNPAKYIHSNEDAIPFIPFPYLMRKVGEDDIPKDIRDKLACRAIIEVRGVKYVAFYLKVSEATNERVTINQVVSNEKGEVVSNDPLEPSTRPLKPSRDPNFTGEAPSSNEFLQIRSPILLSLTPSDIAEILNCAAILFDSTDIEITEFSMVAGIEHPHMVTDGGTNISYTEVIAAQSTHFSPAKFSAAQRLDVGIDIEFKLGQSMPMA